MSQTILPAKRLLGPGDPAYEPLVNRRQAHRARRRGHELGGDRRGHEPARTGHARGDRAPHAPLRARARQPARGRRRVRRRPRACARRRTSTPACTGRCAAGPRSATSPPSLYRLHKVGAGRRRPDVLADRARRRRPARLPRVPPRRAAHADRGVHAAPRPVPGRAARLRRAVVRGLARGHRAVPGRAARAAAARRPAAAAHGPAPHVRRRRRAVLSCASSPPRCRRP